MIYRVKYANLNTMRKFLLVSLPIIFAATLAVALTISDHVKLLSFKTNVNNNMSVSNYYLKKANYYMDKGQNIAAWTNLHFLLNKEPTNTVALNKLVNLAVTMNKTDDAIDFVESAIAMNQADAPVYAIYSKLLALNGDTSKSMEAYRIAITMQPNLVWELDSSLASIK